MRIDMKQVGGRIRQVRNDRGLSQDVLGEKLGVQSATVSKYENGHVDPGTIGLSIIAELGNVTLDWLITGKNTTQRQAELTVEDIFAQAINHPELLDRIKQHVVTTIREESPRYGPGPLTDEEQLLIENYRQASPAFRQAAATMIETSAKELRAKDGGGSDLKAENSA